MKISDKDYEELVQESMRVLTDNGLHPYMVQSERQRWDIFSRVDYKLQNRLYSYLDDTHIGTALKRIFKR